MQDPTTKIDLEAPTDLAVTPFLGNPELKRQNILFTRDREEAFQRGVKEYPEEALLFLNQRRLRTRATLLKSHFIPPQEGGHVAYAVKANASEKILKILTEQGVASFDCASTGEIERVLAINPRAEVFYNHPIKKQRDIRHAIQMGIRHFTVQSVREVIKILESVEGIEPEELEIAVRLDTPNPHAGINLSEKFGASEENVRGMIRDIRNMGAQPGISIHTGSQNTDPHIFSEGIKKMMSIARETSGVKSINVGGGLPANIFETDHFDLEAFLFTICATIRAEIQGVFRHDPKIIIEPGRSMVAESVDLLIPILSVEERNGEKVLYMDDGVFTSFSDAAIHRWQYPFKAWRKNGKSFSSRTIPIRTFGRTCDSGDCLGMIQLPEDIQEGDYIHVPTAGAYTDSQSSHFNGFDPPRYLSYNI